MGPQTSTSTAPTLRSGTSVQVGGAGWEEPCEYSGVGVLCCTAQVWYTHIQWGLLSLSLSPPFPLSLSPALPLPLGEAMLQAAGGKMSTRTGEVLSYVEGDALNKDGVVASLDHHDWYLSKAKKD